MVCTDQEKQKGLAILYSPSDDGTRPVACDGSVPWWTNQHIELIHATNPTDVSTAYVGQGNTIDVLVNNLTAATIENVNVEAWVCNFTLGVGPASSLPPPGTGPGKLTGFAPSVAPGATPTRIHCSPTWTPTSDQIINVDGDHGHLCIGANVYSDGGDGEPLPSGGFNFCCNARQGQRNIAIKAVPGGPGMRQLIFTFQLANPNGSRQLVTTVDVRRTTGRFAMTAADRKMLQINPIVHQMTQNRQPAVRETETVSAARRPAIDIHSLPNHAVPQLVRALPVSLAQFRLSPLRLAALDLHLPEHGTARSSRLNVTLEPAERTAIELRVEFSAGEQVGNVHTFDMLQRAENGDILGGGRVFAVIT